MPIILFIIILALLVFVHELGHFIAAKRSGIKVTEFAIGFPPKIWSVKKGETEYSLNLIPIGGYVKIFGEDPNDESLSGPDKERSVTAKPKYIQAWVLIAGVFFNVLFAWLLISAGYIIGLPTSENHVGPGIVQNLELTVTAVNPESPAYESGIRIGDRIVGATSEEIYTLDTVSASSVSNFIEAHGRDGINFTVERGGELLEIPVIAKEGVIANRVAIGIAMDSIGILQLPVHLAISEGLKDVARLFIATTWGLITFIGNIFVGQGDLTQVTGPVGIAGLVGEVSKLGFVYLMSFTALISINLAVINLFPFPALDGGRLLLLGIEAITRRKIPPQVANAINGIGFGLLLLLMVVVTFHDVLKLF